MDVLVLGGGGFIGRHLCAELVDRGHDVTALSRSPDPSVLPDGVATAEGDVTDYASIEGDFEGRDAAVNLVDLPPLHQPRGVYHDSVSVGGAINFVEAAQQHGVGKLVEMSSLGADPSADVTYWRNQALGEQVVRTSDRDWTIFRPSFVFGEGSKTFDFIERYTTPYLTVLPDGGERPRFQPIWVEDFVRMLAEAVEDDEHVGETYELGGPAVLDFADVTRMLYRAEGKSVEILSVPMQLAEVALYAADPILSIPLGIDQARALEMTNVTDHNDVDAFGLSESDLTTLSSYLSGTPNRARRVPVQSGTVN